MREHCAAGSPEYVIFQPSVVFGPGDAFIERLIRKSGRPVILALNKIDGMRRDTLLALGGNLDRTPGGSHPFPPVSQWSYTQHAPFAAVYDTNRRSVYLMTQRLKRHPFLALFDGADTNASTARRIPTTVPPQALFFMKTGGRNLLIANPRDFQTPTASFEETTGSFKLINKFQGNLWVADARNHRVLRFANAATIASGTVSTTGPCRSSRT